ncbi:MAG: hypothetical protein R3324_20875, partial [Halobacteriales archaeon]|nr:hypothetical protein [Halobacteriales archaeon]
HLNGTKSTNHYLRYLNDEQLRAVTRQNVEAPAFVRDLVEFMQDLDTDIDGDATHTFQGRFGDIDSFEVVGRERILMTFKDGATLELDGGSNDLDRDTEIHILDADGVRTTVEFRDLDHVDFMAAPEDFTEAFGTALWGTVETREGSFTGWIQWDHDERLGTDELDGDVEETGQGVSIPFDQVVSIVPHRGGSLVTTRDGRERHLVDSNDVDDDIRGIYIDVDGLGRVDVTDWDIVERVTFVHPPPAPPAGFDDYPVPRPLSGTVTTRAGESFSGRIAYDLDESWDLEMLDGDSGDLEYAIPMRNIRSIARLDRYASRVVLRDGSELELEDGQDVSDGHDGILVFEDG